MKQYVAFLRAINVGGTKAVKMDDLRKIFESFGFTNVHTHINSGNVIFNTTETDDMEAVLERHLETAMGFKVETFLRTMEEVANVVNRPAFEMQDGETLHVVFLRNRQPAEKIPKQNLLSLRSEADDFAIQGSEVYNLRRNRDKSIFSNNLIEKTLKVKGTTRNITTLRKIVEKYQQEITNAKRNLCPGNTSPKNRKGRI